jgi:hypothetical protein
LNSTTQPSYSVPLVSDFNLDLNVDILFQNDSGQAAVWELDGFTQVATGNVGANPGTAWDIVGYGDVDNDQKADIFWRSDSGQLLIWTMDGLTHTGTFDLGQPDSAWRVRGIGDFNEDGVADILFHHTGGAVAIWSMDDDGSGARAFSNVVGDPGDGGATWTIISAGDFDGDGASDILWQSTTGQVVIWFMGDAGGDGDPDHTGSITVGNPGTTWHAIAAGDFNGDGTDDILFQNDSGRAAIWLIDDGEIEDADEIGANPGADWHVQGAMDADGDGKADILWQNDTGAVAVWTMDGLTQIGGLDLEHHRRRRIAIPGRRHRLLRRWCSER